MKAEIIYSAINKIKVTMLFISHQIQKRLQVEEMFIFVSQQHETKVDLVGEEVK